MISPTKRRSTGTLAALIEALCRAYPGLSPERIVGHSEIAPGRKSDPGPAFDWPRLRSTLRHTPAGSGASG